MKTGIIGLPQVGKTAGSEAKARAKGALRLEGKDYLVQDGDVMHIRHRG